MTVQELAQQILDIAQKALSKEKQVAIYIGDDAGECAARDGLEAIIKLCKEIPHNEQKSRRVSSQFSEHGAESR